MTVIILAAFLMVGAACFLGISKLGKISCGNDAETFCIAVCDLYAASWVTSGNIPQVKVFYGSSREVLSAVREGRAVLGVLAEAPKDSSVCAVKIEISPEEITLGDVNVCSLSEAVRTYYLVYSADIHDNKISELIETLEKL